MQRSNNSRVVPFFDFKALFAEDPAGFSTVFKNTLANGRIILQGDVDTFEGRLSGFLGCRYSIATSDCTNAMLLGMRALGFGQGDEIIFSSHTFVATAQAIHFSGAKPVPVDIAEDRMIDPASVESAIGPRTTAIMVTQLNGRVCDMERIRLIAERHGLAIVEDAAQALGASFAGRRAGTFGTFGAFSFYPSKLLGTFGDGGALTTNDDKVSEIVFRARNHGANRQKQLDLEAQVWGTNSRLDNLQAAFLNHKFDRFPCTLARRRQIARTYHEAFEGLPDFGRPPGPDAPGPYFDVYQNYEIDVGDRDALRNSLKNNGIDTILQWGGAAVHQMTGLGVRQRWPATERFFERCFLLPMHQFLSDEDVLHVCSIVRQHYGAGPWTSVAAMTALDTPPLDTIAKHT
jgi:dTDP-4-amino-4,6-dideoxygalactose transaminase